MKTINDYNFKNKKALIRVDFNVPQDENLNVTDDTRIRAAQPTITKILNDGGAVILMSHLGRPKGEFNAKFSLKNIASKVSEILGVNVIVAEETSKCCCKFFIHIQLFLNNCHKDYVKVQV